jgi:hypothetical protein
VKLFLYALRRDVALNLTEPVYELPG